MACATGTEALPLFVKEVAKTDMADPKPGLVASAAAAEDGVMAELTNAGERVNDAEGAGAAEIMADMAANELCTLLQN